MTTPTPVRSLTDLKHHLAGGTAPIGALVYWRGIHDVRIARAAFRAAFDAMGLGKAVGRDPKPEACLNMAAGVAVRRRDRKSTAKVQLKTKDTHAVYAVLMRRDVTTGALGETLQEPRIRYIEEARVGIDRKQSNPTPQVVTASNVAQDDGRDELIADMVREYHDVMGCIRTQEASEALMLAMSLLGGLSLRPGVYFVPARSMATVVELKAFMESQSSVEIVAWDIAATDANAGEARRDARAAFLDRVKLLADECRTFTAGLGKEEASAKSINARIKRYHDLEGQTQLYADILGDYATELHSVITAARDTFKRDVLGFDDEAVAA